MAAVGPGTFGVELKRWRLAAGLTQEALAERAGVSAKAVSDLERNPARAPRLETVALLADALQLDAAARRRLLAAARPDAAPFEPLPPWESGDNGLPRPLTPLFGREGVADAVAAIVRRGDQPGGTRLLVLTGPGGVGKTRLAITVAARVAGDFGDGVVFVDLAPLADPALVIATIARRFAIDEREKVPPRDRLAAVLRQKRLVLLLDNFEHLLACREEVLSLLETCPRLVVLVTSRVALRVRGEREYRVAPLEWPGPVAPLDEIARFPAVALFLDRARAAGADLELSAATAPAVAEICHRLDGLPLAVELAAAWARLLPPPALLARLDRRLPLLIGGPHDLPARQRTMRDTIAWSYELLNVQEQRLFRTLCVFVGGCTAEAVEAIATEDELPVLQGLAALVDRSLLRTRDAVSVNSGESRLTMLETLREYGLEQLENHGESDLVRGRHARYYLALAEAADAALHGRDGAVWGARLDLDHGNLRAALGWLLARGETAAALRLGAALAGFWSERGHLSEGRSWLREVLDQRIDDEQAGVSVRVKALLGSARLAIDQGAYDEADARSAEAVTLARDRTMPVDLVLALNGRGLLARERGDYTGAADCHQTALALAQQLGDQSGEADALAGLGYAAMFAGDVTRGSALLARSLAVFRVVGDRRGLAGTLVALAIETQHTGDYARSEAFATEALALGRDLGDTGRMAGALWVLGVGAMMQDRHERAMELFAENLALCRARGDERGTVQPLAASASIALQHGDYPRARSLLEETLVILEGYDDRWGSAMSRTLLGHVELAAGDANRANGHFADAAPLFQAIGNPLYVPWCLEGLAGVAAARSDWVSAARLCGARDALHAALGLGVPPAHPAGYARTVAACRAALGDAAFAAALETGQRIPPEWALAEAGVIAPDGNR